MSVTNFAIFQHALELKNIDVKISNYLFLTLCNMLAIDFNLRNINLDVSQYALSCSVNLSDYLKNRTFYNDNFDDAFLLFTIAIKLNHEKDQKKLQTIKNQVSSQNKEKFKMVDGSKFDNLSQKETNLISDILSQLYFVNSTTNINNLINQLNKDDKIKLLYQAKRQKIVSGLLNFIKIRQKDVREKNSNLLMK